MLPLKLNYWIIEKNCRGIVDNPQNVVSSQTFLMADTEYHLILTIVDRKERKIWNWMVFLLLQREEQRSQLR